MTRRSEPLSTMERRQTSPLWLRVMAWIVVMAGSWFLAGLLLWVTVRCLRAT